MTMTFFDDIKQRIPMEKIHALWTDAKSRMGAVTVKKDDPVLIEANKILKRIHYLVAEHASLDLGREDVFTRSILGKNGKTKNYTYSVNFHRPEEVKRLQTIRLELADLSSPDASKAKHDSIPAYLDYVAQSNI